MNAQKEISLTIGDVANLLEAVLRKKTSAPMAATIDGKRIDDIKQKSRAGGVIAIEIFTRHGESIAVTGVGRITQTEIELLIDHGGEAYLAFQPEAADLEIHDVLARAQPGPTIEEVNAGLDKIKRVIDRAFQKGIRAHIHGSEIIPPLMLKKLPDDRHILTAYSSTREQIISSLDGEDYYTFQVTTRPGERAEIDFTRQGQTIPLTDVIDAAA